MHEKDTNNTKQRQNVGVVCTQNKLGHTEHFVSMPHMQKERERAYRAWPSSPQMAWPLLKEYECSIVWIIKTSKHQTAPQWVFVCYMSAQCHVVSVCMSKWVNTNRALVPTPNLHKSEVSHTPPLDTCQNEADVKNFQTDKDWTTREQIGKSRKINVEKQIETSPLTHLPLLHGPLVSACQTHL